MFKKFYIYLILSSTLITFIFSFSETNIGEYYYPIKGNTYISSYYGIRELYGKYNFHNGVDIPASSGTPVYSIQAGIVKYIGFDSDGYGNYIVILHTNSYKTIYGHLSENFTVSIGDELSKGQLIAYVGPKILSNGMQNGNTTGSHLHFSVYSEDGKTINPMSLNYKK